MEEEYKEKRNCADCCVPLNKVKTRVTIFSALCTLLFIALIGTNAWSVFADDDKKVKDQMQDSEIKHNRELINSITDSQEEVVKALNRFREVQVEVVTTLKKIKE